MDCGQGGDYCVDFINQPSLRSFYKINCDYSYSEADLSELLYYHVVPAPSYEVSFAGVVSTV
jgi:hypothetical protein